MIGKRIKVNDFKFKYGQETIYINVFAAFKYKKNGNKYIIYSYDNTKIYYGSLFIRDKEMVVMLSKDDNEILFDQFITNLLNNSINNDFEIISLDNITNVQIIDEGIITNNFDIVKLYDLTIPKENIKKEVVTTNKKKKISFSAISFMILIIVLALFFFFNPEVIIGKDKSYSCIKEYNHKELSASVREEVKLTFNGVGKIKNSVVTNDYIFTDNTQYVKFKDNGKFYKYMNDGDTYKFIDDDNTYRVISKIDNLDEYFSSDKENVLIEYYEGNNYKCKNIETE